MKTLIKYVIGLGFVLLNMQIAFAQSPQGLNYQAVAHDASGNVLANKSLEVKVGIHNFTTSALDYEELHVVETDEFGLFALIVGNGEPLQGAFTQLDWGSNSYGIAVHLDAGSGFKDLGVNILQSIPYAFYADKAGSIDNVFLKDLEDVNVEDLQEGYVLTWDGSTWKANPVAIEELVISHEEIKVSAGAGLNGGGTFTGEVPAEIQLDAAIDEPIWNANRMQGRIIVDADPNEGDVMKWNGQEWAPQPDEKAEEGGAGDIEAVVVGTGLTGGGASGEVKLEATHQEPIWNAEKLQGRNVANAVPNRGDVLKWDGNQWNVDGDAQGPWSLVGEVAVYSKGSVGINTSKMIGRSNLTLLSTFSDGYGGMQVAMNAPSGVPRPDLKPFYGYAIDGVPLSWTYYDNLSNQWRVYNSGDRLVVRSNGQVGIGTTNPQFDLHVNGTAGKPGGGSWSNASDKRLKTDISDFTKGLDIVQKVRPIHFRYNGKLGYVTDEAYVGVIAQELQTIAPFMVSEFTGEDGETYLNVDPSAFDFILINAIKEQQGLIMRLQAQIDVQQQQITLLQEHTNKVKILAEKIAALEAQFAQQENLPEIDPSSE